MVKYNLKNIYIASLKQMEAGRIAIYNPEKFPCVEYSIACISDKCNRAVQ